MTILLLLGLAAYGLITFISVVNRDSYNMDDTVYTLGSEEWDVDWRDFRILTIKTLFCDEDCKLLTTRPCFRIIFKIIENKIEIKRYISTS